MQRERPYCAWRVNLTIDYGPVFTVVAPVIVTAANRAQWNCDEQPRTQFSGGVQSWNTARSQFTKD